MKRRESFISDGTNCRRRFVVRIKHRGNLTGKSVRAAVAHVFEISDGKIVRFDQYVDSATINPIIGA